MYFALAFTISIVKNEVEPEVILWCDEKYRVHGAIWLAM